VSTFLELWQALPQKAFAKGAVVLEEGTRTSGLYALKSGSVEVVKGNVQINTIAEPGSMFGEVSFLLDVPHTATVRALEDSVFHVVDDVSAFLRDHPQVALEVSRLLARRLHLLTTYLVDLKRQFEGSGDHLAMVDDVIESLVHHQEADADTGSDRYPDTTVD
jgi:CRP-like cAMP-binding protein